MRFIVTKVFNFFPVFVRYRVEFFYHVDVKKKKRQDVKSILLTHESNKEGVYIDLGLVENSRIRRVENSDFFLKKSKG